MCAQRQILTGEQWAQELALYHTDAELPREAIGFQRVENSKCITGQIGCSLLVQVGQKKERWNRYL